MTCKNILATAVLISDRLESSADPAVRRVAPRLIETLDRAVRLCGETLSYARSGPPAPQPRRVALAELVQNVRDASTARWHQCHLAHRSCRRGWRSWSTPTSCSGCCSTWPRTRWRRWASAAASCRSRPGSGPSCSTIEVADTGPGIPDQVRARLFEPFAGSSKPDGNGLGLAICRELMRAHGGEIELAGTSERGTVFRLRLPARLCSRAPAARRAAMPLEKIARIVLLPFLLAQAGCDYKGPALAGYPGAAVPGDQLLRQQCAGAERDLHPAADALGHPEPRWSTRRRSRWS